MASETERDVKITDSNKNTLSFSFNVKDIHIPPPPEDFHSMKLQCAGQAPQDLTFDQFKPLIDQIVESAVSSPDKARNPLEMDLAGGVNLPIGHFTADWDVTPGPTPLQSACGPKISSTAKPRTIG